MSIGGSDVPSDMQRVAKSLEELSDQLRDDLRDIDRALNSLGDDFRDDIREIREHLDRIEEKIRRLDTRERERTTTGPIPLGPIPVTMVDSGPIALRPPGDTQPTKLPEFEREHTGITADHEKITLHWETLGKVWTIIKVPVFVGGGALAHYLLEWWQRLQHIGGK